MSRRCQSLGLGDIHKADMHRKPCRNGDKMEGIKEISEKAKILFIKKMWMEQPESFPVFLEENRELFPRIGDGQKKENEALVEEFSKRIQKKVRQRPEDEQLIKQWERELDQELETELGELLTRERIVGVASRMRGEMLEDLKNETKHFIRRIREFDDTLNGGQIWQAMRNYFIYAMIVEMQGEKQNAGNPILAYSLLYPYTDNYIDNARISPKKKAQYNRMIEKKLKGEETVPETPLEEKTCLLLDMILGSYEGEAQKKVAETLLQLLYAQKFSIAQLEKDVKEEEVLGISIWKGSVSVLADYFFATMDWAEKEEDFYLKLGFILQLVDDLQDMEEDRKEGSHTLMTLARGKGLEKRVNHLLWFAWNVLRDFEPKNPGPKAFVLENCVKVILLSAAGNGQYFSKDYLKTLESYLPFSLEYIKRGKIELILRNVLKLKQGN